MWQRLGSVRRLRLWRSKALGGSGGCWRNRGRRDRILGFAQNRGGVAQLGERLLCKQEVVGSIPITSTSAPCGRADVRGQMSDDRMSAGLSCELSIGNDKFAGRESGWRCDL